MPHSTTPCAAIALLALSALAPPASPASTGNELRTLTPSQMEQDLFRLTEALEAEHAGLLRYTSREELDAAYGDALQAMEEERTILEFYRIIASIVARVRCGHTRLAMKIGRAHV